MKTKMELAHEYALVRLTCGNPKTLDEIISLSWYYADAMQAEADKRNKTEAAQKRKEIREMLNAPNTFVECEGQHFDDIEEWQPDWSQAPGWAKWWCVGQLSGKAMWSQNKPHSVLLHGVNYWSIDFPDGENTNAPTFDYKGNWKDSLRERPE